MKSVVQTALIRLGSYEIKRVEWRIRDSLSMAVLRPDTLLLEAIVLRIVALSVSMTARNRVWHRRCLRAGMLR